VLIASSASVLPVIAPNDVRKAFLGLPVVVNEKTIVPILNSSSADAKELFLQRVLFMSSPVFERHSIGRVFRNGGNKLADYTDQVALINAISVNPLCVSFMNIVDAKKLTSIRVLGEL
jgi:hypothetical protein